MFETGWFWVFAALFFIWGPMRWGRRHRWGMWDPMGWERSQKGTPANERQSRDEAERQTRRDEQLEQLEARVNELESRLDFAERLLASRREPAETARRLDG